MASGHVARPGHRLGSLPRGPSILLNLVQVYPDTRAWLDYESDFRGKKDALGQNPSQLGPKCQDGGGTTAYVARPHAPDGAPTVGAARIGRGAVLEGSAAT
jgi:hypothetical protein